jgi:2-iminobutanoate/2-iminopropanoate deaminase
MVEARAAGKKRVERFRNEVRTKRRPYLTLLGGPAVIIYMRALRIAGKRFFLYSCPMKKHIIQTEKAPKAVGPYSQGIKVGGFLFVSGQAGLDPATGNLVPGGVEPETRQVFRNIQAILEAARADMNQIVKTTVFLTDMEDFARMNGIYGTFIPEPYPARSTVQVSALPKGASVEIEVIVQI